MPRLNSIGTSVIDFVLRKPTVAEKLAEKPSCMNVCTKLQHIDFNCPEGSVQIPPRGFSNGLLTEVSGFFEFVGDKTINFIQNLKK